MTRVFIRTNAATDKEDQIHDLPDDIGVPEFLYREFSTWPETAKIYRGCVSQDTEVPMNTVSDVIAMNALSGDVYVVIYPQGFAALGIGLLAATVGIQVFVKSKSSASSQVAAVTRRNQQVGSPNNGLAERTNQARMFQRIPDIYGTVRSTPDLLSPPWKEYINHREVEHAFMCVGRGDVECTDIRDDTTLISQIAGASVEVYGPNNSPNFGAPNVTVGGAITAEFVAAKKSNAINGQQVLAPNTGDGVFTYSRLKFVGADKIVIDNSVPVDPELENDIQWDFTEFFAVNDVLNISQSQRTEGGASFSLDGNYQVLAVTGTEITIENGTAINPGWFVVRDNLGETAFGRGRLQTSTIREVGPFIIEDASDLVANFVASQGLYRDNGENQQAIEVELKLIVQQVDSVDVPFGPVHEVVDTIIGSDSTRDRRAKTIKTALPFSGRVQVRAMRVTEKDFSFAGQVSDEIQWEALYSTQPITQQSFGNVTTCRASTFSTPGALTLKSRKLNMQASRKIPVLQPDQTTFSAPQTTSNFSDIAIAICTDAKIGDRQLDELDLVNFDQTRAAVQAYFGSTTALQFNHTFDDDNISFEETLSIVGEAVFCEAFRQGRIIRWHFERETDSSLLLFNHRNKVPRSEKRTVTFGNFGEKDGVELQYTNPDDGVAETYYLPADQSATNPERVTQLGITNQLQAYWHAHRLWNQIRYQNVSVEFDALQEANLLRLNDRIQVADNTRPETWDGEVIEQSGLTITLSQRFVFEAGETYTIFLQNADATVQAIAITEGLQPNQVVLAAPPALALSTASELYARTTYEIVKNSSARKAAFLVKEKDPADSFITTVRAINYDDRFYQNDTDLITGVIDALGNIL